MFINSQAILCVKKGSSIDLGRLGCTLLFFLPTQSVQECPPLSTKLVFYCSDRKQHQNRHKCVMMRADFRTSVHCNFLEISSAFSSPKSSAELLELLFPRAFDSSLVNTCMYLRKKKNCACLIRSTLHSQSTSLMTNHLQQTFI